MVGRFVSGVPSGRTNNYPESGRGLGHVTPTIFGIRSNISLKVLELETSNLIHGFVWAMPSRRINNFPESRRGLGDVTLQFWAVRSAILATAWLLVCAVLKKDAVRSQPTWKKADPERSCFSPVIQLHTATKFEEVRRQIWTKTERCF